MLRFLRALLMSAAGCVDWLSRYVWQGLTGRSLAAEAAEEEQARANAERAEAAEEEQRAHRTVLVDLAAQTLEATLALREAAPVIDDTAARQAREAERRARADEHKAQDEARREAARALERRKAAIADQGRTHVPEIRSSLFRTTGDPEPATDTLKVA